jgi:Zn-dependent peptidase ImmA (M78 family)
MDEIEDKARKTFAIAEAQKLVKALNVTEAPISLFKVVEHLKTKHNLQIRKMSELDQGVHGFLTKEIDIYDDEKFVIGFNDKNSWYKNRYTIAHEIGHLVLGHECSHGLDKNIEREAEVFASELLMPKKILKKDFTAHQNIPVLSEMYRVSQQAMGIKVQTYRLIKF